MSLKISPHLKCVTTLRCKMSIVCRSVSLIAPLVSGVAGMTALSSVKADTLNIRCKNCRMWQHPKTRRYTQNSWLYVL